MLQKTQRQPMPSAISPATVGPNSAGTIQALDVRAIILARELSG